MAATKPSLGQVVTFKFFKGTTVTGPVMKFVVDDSTRWKVAIRAEKIEGQNAEIYRPDYLNAQVLCEDYEFVEAKSQPSNAVP